MSYESTLGNCVPHLSAQSPALSTAQKAYKLVQSLYDRVGVAGALDGR